MNYDVIIIGAGLEGFLQHMNLMKEMPDCKWQSSKRDIPLRKENVRLTAKR